MSLPPPDPKIIIGLTTTPKRLGVVAPTIQSLLNQTRKADKIVLAVPSVMVRTGESCGPIPDNLQELCKGGVLDIQTVEDRGPGTKIVAGYDNAQADDYVVWCDDDILYPENLLSVLIQCCISELAIATSGFFMLHNRYCPVDYHFGYAEFLEGFGGVCCRKRNLPDVRTLFPAMTVDSYRKLTPVERARFVADDYVISNALRKRSVPTLVCHREDLNRGHVLQAVRPEGLGQDALHMNQEFGGNLGSYSFLKIHEPA